ncbi:MAG TPA: hypothetical protein VGD98_06580 [Ktedonobacteraceae bacterium]
MHQSYFSVTALLARDRGNCHSRPVGSARKDEATRSRSLLLQLLSVYLLFVIVVLAGGLGVNAIFERRLSDDVHASDQALAQEVGHPVI